LQKSETGSGGDNGTAAAAAETKVHQKQCEIQCVLQRTTTAKSAAAHTCCDAPCPTPHCTKCHALAFATQLRQLAGKLAQAAEA
jgi:hypothetical protein